MTKRKKFRIKNDGCRKPRPPEGYVFRNAFLYGKDARFTLSDADAETLDRAGRGEGVKGEAYCYTRGRKFRFHGASCGLPNCFCAWRAEPV